ncbi:MAG TPA: gliding motility-associated protein GldE [Paludibacter sp.]|nr:gliding motility-associated protein GldE [Paludibacter sp.]
MNIPIVSSVFSAITFVAPTVSAIISLVLSVLLLLISALISASEVAFFSLNPLDIKELRESENVKDRKIMRMLDNPQRLLATILIGNNFVNVAIILLLTNFTNSVVLFGNSAVLSFVFQTVIITFLLLLFGEITPKVYATQFSRKVANFTVPLLLALENIFSPIVKFLVHSTSIVNSRLAKHGRSNISMEELSQALELTTNNKDEDTDILEGIIKFGNIQVIDIMTSRVDMVDINIKTSYKKLLEIIIKSGYSRLPVYTGTRDNIKGVLYSKDLLAHLDKPDTFRWQTLVRPSYYVPETKKIDDLLIEFQMNKVHLAIVVDEYGGISGMVTLEDILEEIVGDISDEYDQDESLFTKLDNHTFVFEAKIQLNDFFKIDEIREEDFVKIADEVETLAGLILELKGEMPIKGERVDYKRYVFEVMALDNRRIIKVKLYIKDDFKVND